MSEWASGDGLGSTLDAGGPRTLSDKPPNLADKLAAVSAAL